LKKTQNGFVNSARNACYAGPHQLSHLAVFFLQIPGPARPVHPAPARRESAYGAVIMDPDRSITRKFKKLWKHYILQSLLGSLTLLVIVLVRGEEQMIVTATIGSTAFIVFAMPQSISAKTRNVLGGHLVGLGSGSLLFCVPLEPYLEYPLALGLAIFLMVALDVEHPPAAATALAVVINQGHRDVFLTVLVSALILSQARFYLRHYLKDLV